jgi:hypothetical protein
MNREPLYNTIKELCSSINLLHSNSLSLPALMMTFATIDIMSSLACTTQQTESNGTDFRDWVNRYLLPDIKLLCTADDLWGARCGLLHAYTPDSRDSKRGKARQMIYIKRIVDEIATEKYVAVAPQDLFNALSSALCRFTEDLEKDVDLKNHVTARTSNYYVPI